MEFPKKQIFVFSSWMLKESFDITTALPEEGMAFIAGINYCGRKIGTRMIELPYEQRSVGGIKNDIGSSLRTYTETREGGHYQVAFIHSHPGSGFFANIPSNIDLIFQTALEQTANVVGGVWSRDGFLRFYSHKMPYEIKIRGNHLRKIKKNVFQLV